MKGEALHDGENSHSPDPTFSRLCSVGAKARLDVRIHHAKDEALRYTGIALVDEKGRTPYYEPIVGNDIPAATARLASSFDAKGGKA